MKVGDKVIVDPRLPKLYEVIWGSPWSQLKIEL